MQYIFAMVCLAVSIVASVILNSYGMYDSKKLNPMMGLMFVILYVGGMYYVCMVIKKILSYKRSMLGLWATRGLFAISLAPFFLLIWVAFGALKVANGTCDDYIFLSQLKTMSIICSIVYTSVFAVLGWAIIGLKDHAKGGRWFMWTGAALILCTVLSFIFQMYDVININLEDAMANDESSSWLESMPWEFVVLFAVFVVGYMFLSENEVRGRYGRVADNSVKWSEAIILLLVLWFLGIRVIVLVALVVLAVFGIFMIKYVPLPSADALSADAPKEGNAEVAKMLAEDGKATMKNWLLIGVGVIVLLVLWLM